MMDSFSYFMFQPMIHDLCTKTVIYAILSVGWCVSKEHVQPIGVARGGGGFPLTLSGPLTYVRRHTFNVLTAFLKKYIYFFPSVIPRQTTLSVLTCQYAMF